RGKAIAAVAWFSGAERHRCAGPREVGGGGREAGRRRRPRAVRLQSAGKARRSAKGRPSAARAGTSGPEAQARRNSRVRENSAHG
ncbi:unnamed protein product, partial [Effrenium voratum]